MLGAAVPTIEPTPREAHGAPLQFGNYRSPHLVQDRGYRIGLCDDHDRYSVSGAAEQPIATRFERDD